MAKITRRITLIKESGRTLDVQKLAQQIQQVKAKAIPKALMRKGWSCSANSNGWETEKTDDGKGLRYKVQLSVSLVSKREREQSLIDVEYEVITNSVIAESRKVQWEVMSTRDVKGTLKPEKYADVSVPKNWLSYFSHIYGREDQVNLVLSAVHAGMKSNWNDRFHRLLVGPPASGKTEIVRAVGAMVGPDSILHLDGTLTSQAGAIKDITERDTIPRIIAIEEIEKADESQLKFLLGVLDHRAEIRKTNFRGSIQRTVKSLVLATVNDWRLFSGMMSGALASRFGAPILCPAPDEKILRKILEREIARPDVKGKPKWIDATMKYIHERGITDPRIVLQICLCGRDDLITGKYQKMLDRCDATNFLTKRQQAALIVPSENGDTHQKPVPSFNPRRRR